MLPGMSLGGPFSGMPGIAILVLPKRATKVGQSWEEKKTILAAAPRSARPHFSSMDVSYRVRSTLTRLEPITGLWGVAP